MSVYVIKPVLLNSIWVQKHSTAISAGGSFLRRPNHRPLWDGACGGAARMSCAVVFFEAIFGKKWTGFTSSMVTVEGISGIVLVLFVYVAIPFLDKPLIAIGTLVLLIMSGFIGRRSFELRAVWRQSWLASQDTLISWWRRLGSCGVVVHDMRVIGGSLTRLCGYN